MPIALRKTIEMTEMTENEGEHERFSTYFSEKQAGYKCPPYRNVRRLAD